MEYSEWERTEERFQSYTLACDAEQVREEIEELRQLTKLARTVEQSGREAKLVQLKSILKTQGFFTDSDQRLLVFTEFKDTLKYLLSHLEDWGFRVGCIHGGMKSGSRDEPGSRLHVEQQFREGSIQVLVATEAAGEGINLQCCHILFNYDIPWNPNRLEQRMGRIHRYGQQQDCLIFNFVATNTIEGRVLQRLMDKLQEIRQALDDDAVFNVIGDILPTAQVESVLRDYYSGKLGEVDLEQQMLKDVDESRFRAICQNALEGLATRNLNFNMLMERQAKAREQRIVPESTARFMVECALDTSLSLKKVANLAYTFDPGSTPSELKNYERAENWKLPKVSPRYPRLSTDRETADENNLEWVIPGHPLFEALRRHAFESAESSFLQGSCFYSLAHDELSRLDVYRARAVNGLGRTVHEWLFVIEISESNEPVLRDLQFLHSLSPTSKLSNIPDVAHLPEIDDWLTKKVLSPRLEKVRSDYSFEIKRIAGYVELSLTEVLFRIDGEIGRAHEDVNKQITGAEGRLAQAERRHVEITNRLNTRQKKLEQERAITLQGVERLTSILILPHPEREASEVRNLRPNPETEMKAMQLVEEYEIARGCKVDDVSESNLGYDLRSVDSKTGDLRLIEVKGLSGISGSILLTPNERRVAEDRRDCYWLYIVTNCANNPTLCEPIKDPTRFQWKEISKVQHYRLEVNAMTQPMHSSESQKEIR